MKPDIFKLNRKESTVSSFSPDIEENRDILGSGIEGDVRRVKIKYPEQNKSLDGLVLKRYSDSRALDPGALRGSKFLELLTKNWGKLKKISSDLRTSKEAGFNLPATVRPTQDEQSIGVLMTDLSEGGKKTAFDLKEIGGQKIKISKKDWEKIKADVLLDFDIAAGNNINLLSGPSGLDAWLVVFDPKLHKYTVNLVDIGHVSFYDNATHEIKTEIAVSRKILIRSLAERAPINFS